MKPTAILALLSLAGCSHTYSKPNAADGQFARDRAACIYESDKATAGNPDQFDSFSAALSLVPQCLAQKGWTEVN